MTIWDNLKKTEVDTMAKFHNQHPGHSLDICPVCGADRNQLREWLNEPVVWCHYPNPSSGGFWGKSNNHIKADEIISMVVELINKFVNNK